MLCLSYVENDKESAGIRLQAAAMLLDRGLGRPAPGTMASALTDEELVAELMLRKKVRDAVAERARVSAETNGGQ